MKWTVSSFTSEHLQQSLQHCNESISYDESTDYGSRSSATGNTHLPQHRDRYGRWILTHLQQEHADFQTSGLPLQMCMWFYMTILYLVIQRSFATKDLVYIHLLFIALCPRDPSLRSGWQDKVTVLHVLTNFQTRQGRFFNAPRRIHEFVKEFSRKHQRLFQKVLHLFKKLRQVFKELFCKIKISDQ